jgi:putative SbcD/Mre11-related phosphoesterase
VIYPIKDRPALGLRLEDGEKAVVISDLHIGFESQLAEKGVRVPPQTQGLLNSVLNVTKDEKASRVIFVGDVKASEAKTYAEEWQDVPLFFENLLSEGLSVDVIPGNHDGGLELMLPSGVNFHSPRGMIVKLGDGSKVGLFHGHAWPAPELFSAHLLVIGHNHWAVELKDQMGARIRAPVWVVSRVDTRKMVSSFLQFSSVQFEDPVRKFEELFGETPNEPTVISMPAFNPFLRGRPLNPLDVQDLGLGPLIKEKVLKINDAEVFMLDGTYLGKVEQLPSLLVLGRRGSLKR